MKASSGNGIGSRREFLRGGLRYALLAGVGMAAATLARRRCDELPGQGCISDGLCRGCAVLGDCGLPQAQSFRQATKGSGT
jgi:hypothetical protein